MQVKEEEEKQEIGRQESFTQAAAVLRQVSLEVGLPVAIAIILGFCGSWLCLQIER